MVATERENKIKKKEWHLMPTTCNARKWEKRRGHLMPSHTLERDKKEGDV